MHIDVTGQVGKRSRLCTHGLVVDCDVNVVYALEFMYIEAGHGSLIPHLVPVKLLEWFR